MSTKNFFFSEKKEIWRFTVETYKSLQSKSFCDFWEIFENSRLSTVNLQISLFYGKQKSYFCRHFEGL